MSESRGRTQPEQGGSGGRHFLRIKGLDRRTLIRLLDRAETFRETPESWPGYPRLVVGLLFLEPSTRTMLGFQSAVVGMGGAGLALAQTKLTPDMSRAESLKDTVRVVSGYCSLLVLRQPVAEALDGAAEVSRVPIINAGNGDEEHPTQAIIDLFAIRRWHGRVDGLRVGIAGDLMGSRAAHSLVLALSLFDLKEVRLMYPEGRGLPSRVTAASASPCTHRLDGLDLQGLDVLYMAGLPPWEAEKEKTNPVRLRLRLTPQAYEQLPHHSVVLCPLPRIDEIDEILDNRRGARYFTQSDDGLFVRLAVMDYVLQRDNGE